MEEEIELRVSGTTPVPSFSRLICGSFEDSARIVVKALGAAAVNQAMKAIARATAKSALKGKKITQITYFTDAQGDEKQISVLNFALSLVNL